MEFGQKNNNFWRFGDTFLAIWRIKEREAECDGRKLKTQRGNT